MSEPVFAVVGHPNKGKSSLVATLARDLTVAVGPEPGTTRDSRRFSLRVNGRILYTLVDTPGFQRARPALEWMRARAPDAASRPAAVAAFVEQNLRAGQFPDECRLLAPVVAGAGLIYVVDGATPYGPEYDAEMEILRWTGQPSMAVINPIGAPRHVDAWRTALAQYFRVVRVLDVLQAPFDQQIDLLRAFGHLREDWREPIDQAVAALLANRSSQVRDAARIIADLLAAALTHRETAEIPLGQDPEPHAHALEDRFRQTLRHLENRARADIEDLYGHRGVDRREARFELLETDLLSRASLVAFGLSRRDLVAAGAVTGALAGGYIDVALLGTSFLTGSIIGGLLGAGGAFFSSPRLAELHILSRPLGSQRLRYGPSRHPQLPFVLLGRARLHHHLIAGRTHARRDALEIPAGPPESALPPLPDNTRHSLASLFARLRPAEPGTTRRATALAELTSLLADLLARPD